jgi:hypothetical protein
MASATCRWSFGAPAEGAPKGVRGSLGEHLWLSHITNISLIVEQKTVMDSRRIDRAGIEMDIF